MAKKSKKHTQAESAADTNTAEAKTPDDAPTEARVVSGWPEVEGQIPDAQDTKKASKKPSEYQGLTQEEVAREEEFLSGIPRFNLAAFLMPPIWGPAHGIWLTILYYPAWILIDDLFFSVYTNPTTAMIVLAVVAAIILFLITLAFALVAGPASAHRAASRGTTKEKYIRQQRIWAVVCAIIAVVMLALATYYNLNIRA